MRAPAESELLVFWIVLEKGPIGVREVQKSVGFSSPSTAIYHLDRLRSSGMIERNPDGKYYALRKTTIGVLSFYVLMGKHLVPKSLIFAVALIMVELAVLALTDFRLEMILSLIPAFLATLVFCYETVNLLKFKRDLFKRRSSFRTLDSNA